jgi:hypothetical protein
MTFIKTILIDNIIDKIIDKIICMDVYEGSSGGQYYKLRVPGQKSNIPYDIHFPVQWIFDEKRQFYDDRDWITGPFYCNYCRSQGMWNGVFIGYCNSCAEIHEYKRGRGLFGYTTDKGIPYEVHHIMNRRNILDITYNLSIFDTYLKNVDVDKIGDAELKKMYANGYYCKDDDDFRKQANENSEVDMEEEEDEYDDYYETYSEDYERENDFKKNTNKKKPVPSQKTIKNKKIMKNKKKMRNKMKMMKIR